VEAVPPDFASWSRARRRAFLAYDTLPSAFVAQLDWLQGHGYTTILPRDLAAHWDTGVPLPPRPVILTFDDGFPSWVTTVLPALREHHMIAEFYLTLDAIRVKALRWSDVRTLAADGNGIGAHDVHHVQLVGVPGKRPPSATVLWHEINDIRAVIKAHVGTAPDSMAYVGGGYNRTLMDLVSKAGYTTARSIGRGVRQRPTDRFRLDVVRVGARDDVVDLATGAMADGLPVFTARMAGTTR
jgi:peptidoglycan/xylan/chitin deacetylase (PgdA/CDA1 family)